MFWRPLREERGVRRYEYMLSFLTLESLRGSTLVREEPSNIPLAISDTPVAMVKLDKSLRSENCAEVTPS